MRICYDIKDKVHYTENTIGYEYRQTGNYNNCAIDAASLNAYALGCKRNTFVRLINDIVLVYTV